jgi:nucleolar protein 56
MEEKISEKAKIPFGIIENGKLAESFSKDPKKAARQYISSIVPAGIISGDIEKLFPYGNYPEWLNQFSIEMASIKIKMDEKPDDSLIILARTYEEISHFSKALKNRHEVLKNYDSFGPISTNTEKLKEKLERKIREKTERIAPNTNSLLGPILTARLLAKANGLEKLSKMPVSKIQILGAEKSLFRYLKDKEEGKDGKTPKYGIIYLSPYIQDAKGNKGKIARLLASKIMLTSRIDFFSKEDRSGPIKEEFLKEYEKISKTIG